MKLSHPGGILEFSNFFTETIQHNAFSKEPFIGRSTALGLFEGLFVHEVLLCPQFHLVDMFQLNYNGAQRWCCSGGRLWR